MTRTTAVEVCDRRFVFSGRIIRVARLDAEGYEFLDDPNMAANTLRAGRQRVDVLAFTPSVLDAHPRYPYHLEWDNVAALPVRTFDEWWTGQIDGRVRNHVRSAFKKGVALREVPFDDALVHGISRLYNECPIRQGIPFAHYGKNIAKVRAENGTYLDRALFIGAFLDDDLIGFVKLVIDHKHTQAGVMQILSMIRHRDKSVTNALVAHAVRCCAEQRLQHLVYSKFGVSQPDRGGLNQFKYANGFQRIRVPRYYVPLTTLGRIAVATRINRRLASHVPEPIAARLKALRARWYTWRLTR